MFEEHLSNDLLAIGHLYLVHEKKIFSHIKLPNSCFAQTAAW